MIPKIRKTASPPYAILLIHLKLPHFRIPTFFYLKKSYYLCTRKEETAG